jgi:opacity protein-like surface antigen
MMDAHLRSLTLCIALSALAAGVQAQDASQDVAQATPTERSAWLLQLSAEAGIGTRDVDIPRDGVLYQVHTGVYPALGVGFELDYRSSQRFSLGLVARYLSSIGLVLDEQLTGGTVHSRKTRSHRFEVAIAPSLYIGTAGWAIRGALGYSVSELDPENHLLTPSYHLGGPFARIAVQLPLGSERLRLILGPEGQLSLQIGDELLALGVSHPGMGAGASAALELSATEHWTVALSYRELHFWLSSASGPSFTDAQRFVAAQLRGSL